MAEVANDDFDLEQYKADLYFEDLRKIDRIKDGVPFTIVVNPRSELQLVRSLLPTDSPELISTLDPKQQSLARQLAERSEAEAQLNTVDLLNAQVFIEGEHMFLPLPVLTTVLALDTEFQHIIGCKDMAMVRGMRRLSELAENAEITAGGLLRLKRAFRRIEVNCLGILASNNDGTYLNMDLSGGERGGDNHIRYGAMITDMQQYFAFMRDFYAAPTKE